MTRARSALVAAVSMCALAGPGADRALAGCGNIVVSPLDTWIGFPAAPYSQLFSQTGGAPPMTWSLTGTLPPGLAFQPQFPGIQGKTGSVGHWPITVTARDSNGCAGSRDYTLSITNVIPRFVAAGLAADPAGNSVFEPGESAVMAPEWRNTSGGTRHPTGSVTFGGPPGASYEVLDGTADYGVVANQSSASCSATGDCYVLAVSDPPQRPALHWDAQLAERLFPNHSGNWLLHVGRSFEDVDAAVPFYAFVETLLHTGVTGGCSAAQFCPAASTSREQMAVFVLRARQGPTYVPPPCTAAPFSDVDPSSPFCRWIAELAARGVVGGCGQGQFCPGAPVRREEAAVFVLRMSSPQPPPSCGTPLFQDVPASSPFCPWIEELARRGVVGGCSVQPPLYCPAQPVTREQMAVIVTAGFGLRLYGP